MKIVVIHPQMVRRGGAENVAIWLSKILASEGHEISFQTSKYNPSEWSQENLPFKIEPIQGNHTYRLLSKNSKSLYRKIPRNLSLILPAFDLAICHNFPSYLWCVKARELSGARLKIIWYCHEPYRTIWGHLTDLHILQKGSGVKRLLTNIGNQLTGKVTLSQLAMMDREAVKKIDLILTNSSFTRQNIYKLFGREGITCYPGIPMHEMEVAELTEEPYFLVVVGKLTRAKNVETAINALALLPDTYQHIKLRVIGTGSRISSLVKLSRQTGTDDRVDFTGPVSKDILLETYRKSLAILYLPLDEPFGLVVLEAGLFQKPVIVSNHGGPSEIVDHMYDGLHVDPLSSKDVCQAMEWILQNPQKRREMAFRLRNKVLKNFTLDNFKERFLHAVEEIL